MSKVVTLGDFIRVGNHMKGFDCSRQTLLEAIDIVWEDDRSFDKEGFIKALVEALFENGVIREPSLMELAVLDSKVMAKFGRNYRMLDLLNAVATFYMFRRDFPRTDVELRRENNVVHLPKSASQ